MARKPRIEYPGAFFHIIVKGNNRQDVFHDDEEGGEIIATNTNYQLLNY